MLERKSVLITGGTGLLGRAIVRHALAAGAAVTFTTFRNEAVARELEAAGARGVQADLRSPETFPKLKAIVKERSEALDVLIHNAAVARDATVSKMDEAAWDEVIDVNLTAAYRLVKTLLPLLYRSEHAKVLFVSSRAARVGSFGAANYAASKAGLEGAWREGDLRSRRHPGIETASQRPTSPERTPPPLGHDAHSLAGRGGGSVQEM